MQVKRKLLLAGGGHTHALLLHQLKTDKRLFKYYDIELISDFPETYYSAMISGYLHGLYQISALTIPVQKMCDSLGIKFTRQHYQNQTADVVSINTGGKYLENGIKPFQSFLERVKSIKSQDDILFRGGGVAAVEVAIALRTNHKNKIAIFEKGERLTSNLPLKASKYLEQLCHKKEIDVHFKNEPKEIFNFEINATGSSPLAKVFRTLQSNENTFVVGDAADGGWPRSGVYAVRQAPLLYENLVRHGEASKLLEFKPQKNALVLMTTGPNTALGTYGDHSLPDSKVCMKLKKFIDEKFMRNFN